MSANFILSALGSHGGFCIAGQPHVIHIKIIFKIFLDCCVKNELEMGKNRRRKTTREARRTPHPRFLMCTMNEFGAMIKWQENSDGAAEGLKV